MKKLLFLLFIGFISNLNMYSQFKCISAFASAGQGDIPDAVNYIPNSSAPMKYIRLNIHYILGEHNTALYPGNFTPYDDGTGNTSYTGYDYAKDLVDKANYYLGSNKKMLRPLINSTAVLDPKYRLVLSGVFFHENNNFYYWSESTTSSLDNLYGSNFGYSINVYFVHRLQSDTDPIAGGAHTPMSGLPVIKFKNCWGRYVWDKTQTYKYGLDVNAIGLSHEVAHDLSLRHTLRTPEGKCDAFAEDYCADTPTKAQIANDSDHADACPDPDDWTKTNLVNNLMDYQSGAYAITPLQLGRIHWSFEHDMQNYKSSFLINSTKSLTSFVDNASYLNNVVNVPSNSNVVVDNHKALYINGGQVTISGGFEVKVGSKLEINRSPF